MYWTFTSFTPTNCDIVFARFNSYGFYLGAGLLASSNTCGNPALTKRVLQGSRPAAGPGPEVLACWYDAGIDGWSTGAQLTPATPPNPNVPLNKFNIACRSSNDRGATFAGGALPPETSPADATNWIYAAKLVANEVAYYLGPMGPTYYSPFGYFRYGGAQFPTVTIDHQANAHIAYTYNPTTLRFGPEQGNIGYGKAAKGTTAPFFAKWTKTAVGVGANAQFFPTIVAQRAWESPKPLIYVAFHDAAVSSKLGVGKQNLVYEIKYRVSTSGGPAFGPAKLVTEHASLSDYSFLGDYIDSGATNGIYQVVWTDNRFAPSIYSSVSHFFSDRF